MGRWLQALRHGQAAGASSSCVAVEAGVTMVGAIQIYSLRRDGGDGQKNQEKRSVRGAPHPCEHPIGCLMTHESRLVRSGDTWTGAS